MTDEGGCRFDRPGLSALGFATTNKGGTTMSRPQIRHLAIVCRDPAAMARFYVDNFQMDLIHTSKTGGHFVTDGHLTVARLQHRLEAESCVGINHFGFQVEDADAVADALEGQGLERPKQRPTNRPYAELRGCDPEGNQFDISQHGYQQVETGLDRIKAEKTPADA
jgi:catechol 2,3-dioxygenase-like lactoylglutathione lyase family enzyme